MATQEQELEECKMPSQTKANAQLGWQLVVGWLVVGWLVGGLVGWSGVWLVCCLVLVCGSSRILDLDCLVDWLVDWLVG